MIGISPTNFFSIQTANKAIRNKLFSPEVVTLGPGWPYRATFLYVGFLAGFLGAHPGLEGSEYIAVPKGLLDS